MNKFKILFLSLFVVLIILTGCTKTVDDPVVNKLPDTKILSYTISTVAELDTSGNYTSDYSVTVYWSGSDVDGSVLEFDYSVDSDTWVRSTAATENIVMSFLNTTDSHALRVRAIDDRGGVDTSPATVTILRDEAGIETTLLDGPPNGAIVSTAVSYRVKATVGEGYITSIDWWVDDGSLLTGSATPDALGESTILVTGLASGAHIVYFAAQRDDGEVDKTPVAVSFTARVGEFTPTIVNDSPVTPGGGWFAGVELPFSWSVVLGYYYGSLPATPFSFAYNDSTNFDNSADPMPGGWVADITTSITPEAGFHDFFLKVRDAAGAISLFRIDFEAADPTFDEGILVVNGVHAPTYGDQIVSKIDSGAYWGDDLDVTFWDIFGDDTSPSAEFTLPGNASYEGGGGAVGPGVLARFSTVVWLGNGYQGDDEAYNSSPILPYLTAGGNLIFASRNANAGGFIPDGGLTDWLNIGWRGLGENALEYEPCFPGLVSMEPFRRGMSATDVFSGGGFMSSSGDHTLITNWDGVSSFTKSDMTSTMIFVHRNGDFNEDYGGNFETYCRGLGVWAHPNFPFSSQTAGDEFPTAGTIEAQGNYIYLAGRHYGFDDAACMANFNFMLKNMCAEQ